MKPRDQSLVKVVVSLRDSLTTFKARDGFLRMKELTSISHN